MNPTNNIFGGQKRGRDNNSDEVNPNIAPMLRGAPQLAPNILDQLRALTNGAQQQPPQQQQQQPQQLQSLQDQLLNLQGQLQVIPQQQQPPPPPQQQQQQQQPPIVLQVLTVPAQGNGLLQSLQGVNTGHNGGQPLIPSGMDANALLAQLGIGGQVGGNAQAVSSNSNIIMNAPAPASVAGVGGNQVLSTIQAPQQQLQQQLQQLISTSQVPQQQVQQQAQQQVQQQLQQVLSTSQVPQQQAQQQLQQLLSAIQVPQQQVQQQQQPLLGGVATGNVLAAPNNNSINLAGLLLPANTPTPAPAAPAGGLNIQSVLQNLLNPPPAPAPLATISLRPDPPMNTQTTLQQILAALPLLQNALAPAATPNALAPAAPPLAVPPAVASMPAPERPLSAPSAPKKNRNSNRRAARARHNQSHLVDNSKTKSKLLYVSTDDERISPHQAYTRQQIELFEAQEVDVHTGAQGRNKSIHLGQVGIRCIHCKELHPKLRTRAAVYYPSRLKVLYQASQNIVNNHLPDYCESIPDDIRAKLVSLDNRRSSVGGGKNYWSAMAATQGVIDTETGLRFRDDDEDIDDGALPGAGPDASPDAGPRSNPGAGTGAGDAGPNIQQL